MGINKGDNQINRKSLQQIMNNAFAEQEQPQNG
jgi:hypothetical protein